MSTLIALVRSVRLEAQALGPRIAAADPQEAERLRGVRDRIDATLASVGAMPALKPAIVTSHVRPPVPTRAFDWCAYRDGAEERGNYGWGQTEAEAINDLLTNCEG